MRLAGQHAQNHMHRPALRGFGQPVGQGFAGGRIMAAINPQFGLRQPALQALDQHPVFQFLQARRPVDRLQADGHGLLRQAQFFRQGQGGGGIVQLMGTGQSRTRQIDRPVKSVKADQRAVCLKGRGKRHRGAFACGKSGQEFHHFGGLASDDGGHAGFQNPGLFLGNRQNRIAEKILMVHGNRRDGGTFRGDDIGRVQPPAQTDFQNQRIGMVLGKSQKRRRRGDLKKRDGAALIGFFDPRQNIFQKRLGNFCAGQNNPFVKADEMRRMISMHALALGFQHGAQ